MKMQLDATQQAAVAKELQLDTAFAEVDVTSMMEVSGGIAIGGCIVLPPKFPIPTKPPIYTTLAIGEEGGPIATTLAIGEEDGGLLY